jgi:thioredoxin 1
MRRSPMKLLFGRLGCALLLTLAFGRLERAVGAEPALPKLLDLGSKQCIPCKAMAPILEELKREYAGTLDVEFVDVWLKENAPLAEKHGIKLIPTQIFFDAAGKELWRHEGFISKEDILAKWRELKVDLGPPSSANARPGSGP